MSNLARHESQILYSEINTKKDSGTFKNYSFQVNDSNYFYPAITVKFPIAILALEKLNSNSLKDRNTTFNLEKDTIKTTFNIEIQTILL